LSETCLINEDQTIITGNISSLDVLLDTWQIGELHDALGMNYERKNFETNLVRYGNAFAFKIGEFMYSFYTIDEMNRILGKGLMVYQDKTGLLILKNSVRFAFISPLCTSEKSVGKITSAGFMPSARASEAISLGLVALSNSP